MQGRVAHSADYWRRIGIITTEEYNTLYAMFVNREQRDDAPIIQYILLHLFSSNKSIAICEEALGYPIRSLKAVCKFIVAQELWTSKNEWLNAIEEHDTEIELNNELRVLFAQHNKTPHHIQLMQQYNLTAGEARVLLSLKNRINRLVTKDLLLHDVYDYQADMPQAKIIDVFVCKLRKKLAEVNAPLEIVTIWGEGYMLKEKETDATLSHTRHSNTND